MIKISAGSSVRLLGQLGTDLTGLTVNFLFEQVNPVTTDGSGFEIAPTNTQMRAATIVDAPSGQAAYTLSPTDTVNAGQYRAQFSYVDGAGALHYFPASGYIQFEVLEFAAPVAFSAIADFCEPVRAIMGDFRTPYRYEDASLASVVRTVVRCGHAPMYAISADALSIVPMVTRPQDFATIVYWSARTLLGPKIRGESWGSRALKVRRNDQRDFYRDLENIIYYTENPAQLASFQSYYSWVNSLAGINVWGLMTEMKVQGPVATAIIGTGGIQINTT
jgi:hypothetical protein